MQMRKGHQCFRVGGPQLYMCGEKGCCVRETVTCKGKLLPLDTKLLGIRIILQALTSELIVGSHIAATGIDFQFCSLYNLVQYIYFKIRIKPINRN